MFRVIKQVFIALINFRGSLAGMANASNFTTYISLNNQSCITRPTLNDLNPDGHNQGLHYYPFRVNLDRFDGSCNIANDTVIRIKEGNETKDINF